MSLYSSRGNLLDDHFSEIAEDLKAVEYGTLIDGEMVSFGLHFFTPEKKTRLLDHLPSRGAP